MSLVEYKKKRNFKKTSEPEGKISKSRTPTGTKKTIFVIQKHWARNLHYDLRLEIKGVLKSWAVPKEPPKEKGVKRLAMMTEDHPYSYAKFEGEISEGYGAGKVKIWDEGTYELEEQDAKKIVFELKGKKLKGRYCLVKTNYGSRPEKSWLFFKL